MSTIWVVEQGEYSDYRVIGVFSSKEHAQLIVDAIKASAENAYSSDATIAEWPLDPVVSELRQGLRLFLVDMRKDGALERCERWTISGYELTGYVRMWRRTKAPAFVGNQADNPDILQAMVWAKDEEHAVKITNEHRAQFIASGEWDHDLSEQVD